MSTNTHRTESSGIERLWTTDALPFNMTVVREPHNPPGFPDVLPFTLGVCTETGLLVQVPFPGLAEQLEAVYEHGSMIGTPLDDTTAGRAIADEFVDHVRIALAARGAATDDALRGARLLEIGCGRGFVLHRLAEAGAEAVGVEPGSAYAPWWARHGVHVVAGLFPHPDLPGPFDGIVAYGVLEHIAAREDFLGAIRAHLVPGGAIALSVPRCTPFLDAGDPSMLLHEHYCYFTESTLARTVARAGFRVSAVHAAREAGAMTVVAHRCDPPELSSATGVEEDLERARRFAARIETGRRRFAAALADARGAGRRVGLYCPGRGRAYLDHANDLRFFDDDAEKEGTCIPPFAPRIEPRAALLARPVDEVWVLSRTYGRRIRASLAAEPTLAGVTLRTIDELLDGCPAPPRRSTGFGRRPPSAIMPLPLARRPETMKTQTRHTIQISYPFFAEEEKQAVAEVMDTGWVTQGPKVRAFEEAFAAAHQAPHAVAVTSCTTGLFLALAAWGIGPGDEVIIPAFTWVTTGNVVIACGATPVFVDVERTSFNLDIAQVAAKVTERTRAVIPVHLFGLCADADALRAVLPPHVKILEDAACGAGATLRGRFAGTLGEAGVFSFHPRKIITTGEGGIITTADEEYAEQLRRLRNHGASVPEEVRHHGPRPYSLPEFNELGYNFRMTDFQGAIGLPQVARLEALVQERRAMAARYDAELADIPWLRTPIVPDGFGHGWQAYVCFVDAERAPHDRNRIMEILQDEWQISTRPGTHALHMLGYYQERFDLADDDFPGARDCHHQAMALPLHNRMSAEDQTRVVDALHALG